MNESFEDWMMYGLVSGLILFMAFIVYDLARQSKAGRYGTLVMFGGLGMGAVGFVAKTILTKFMF